MSRCLVPNPAPKTRGNRFQEACLGKSEVSLQKVVRKNSTHPASLSWQGICDFPSSKHHGTSEQGEIDHAGKRLDVSKREIVLPFPIEDQDND